MKAWCNEDKSIKLINGECLEIMDKLIERGIKVDAIITDLPQGITQNEWDRELDLDMMWDKIKKIRKGPNTPIILFSNQPYTTTLMASNIKMFRYCKYWKKDRPSGFLNARKQPLRDIEDIVVFYEKQCTYNPQMWEGKPLHSLGTSYKSKKDTKNGNYNKFNYTNEMRDNRKGSTEKFPRQLMEYNRPHPPIHSTQKPVDLLEDLVLTYTNEGEIVLDFTMGVASTGVACQNLNRKFIGIELDEKYFDIGVDRIKGGR